MNEMKNEFCLWKVLPVCKKCTSSLEIYLFSLQSVLDIVVADSHYPGSPVLKTPHASGLYVKLSSQLAFLTLKVAVVHELWNKIYKNVTQIKMQFPSNVIYFYHKTVIMKLSCIDIVMSCCKKFCLE